MAKQIPYKIYLSEDEIPKQWYNLNAAMKQKHAPFLNPATLQPCTKDDLRPVFCDECVDQEMNMTDEYIDIPEEIRAFYKMQHRALTLHIHLVHSVRSYVFQIRFAYIFFLLIQLYKIIGIK